MNRVLIVIPLMLFGGLTAVAVWTDGILGIFSSIVSSFGSTQIFVDLVIALVLVSVWMWQDAKATGRNALPWIVATILVGSFSPLLYLLIRKSSEQVTKES